MHFTILDAVIVALYLVGVAWFGIRSGGRQTSARDYFLSEKAVPWWAVCLAIVATETSALTFLSIPGVSYAGNMHFLQVAFGYLLGRLVVARYFIPRYVTGEMATAYAFLGFRFGHAMRASASITFMGTRLLADGVRLYTTAIPLALLLHGFDVLPGVSDHLIYIVAIVVLSMLTMLYVYFGGVRAVIWTDVLQLGVYTLGAVATLLVFNTLFPEGIFARLAAGDLAAKFSILHAGSTDSFSAFFGTPYTLPASLLGGAFLSMASHGTDQLIVQRVLATQSTRGAQKAMIWSGVLVIVQFLLFLVIGVLLHAHLGPGRDPNQVFASFILTELPTGLTGLILAGILAAAMSTLSGSISALASSTVLDILKPLRGADWDEATMLRRSRLVSVFWCIVIILAATLFISTPKTVVELALSIASYTYGGLLGVFLLGLLLRRVQQTDALVGFFVGIVGMGAVIVFTPIAWTWYTLIGSLLTVGTGVVSMLVRASSRGAA